MGTLCGSLLLLCLEAYSAQLFYVVVAFKLCLHLSSLIRSPLLIEIQDISRITAVVRAVNEQKGSSFSASSGH